MKQQQYYTKLACSFIIFMMFNVCTTASTPASILNPPNSTNTTLYHEFVTSHCVATGDFISFLVNGTVDNLSDRGFNQSGITTEGDVLRRTLTAQVSLDVNNTRIACRAITFGPFSQVISETALLLVQGELDPPTDIVSTIINETTVNISWAAPPTLLGTVINGYYVLDLNNGSESIFTEGSNILYSFESPDPCVAEKIQITPFNGINGRPGNTSALYLPSKPNKMIPVSSSRAVNPIMIKFSIDVSELCPGEYPEHVTIKWINATGSLVVLPDIDLAFSADMMASTEYIPLAENQEYVFNFTFGNILGLFEAITPSFVDTKFDDDPRMTTTSSSTTTLLTSSTNSAALAPLPESNLYNAIFVSLSVGVGIVLLLITIFFIGSLIFYKRQNTHATGQPRQELGLPMETQKHLPPPQCHSRSSTNPLLTDSIDSDERPGNRMASYKPPSTERTDQ